MSQEERTNKRPLIYSAWHRSDSLSRFIDERTAVDCHMQDIDSIEYTRDEQGNMVFLAVIETKLDWGQEFEDTGVPKALGKKLGVPVFFVFYTPSQEPNPANPRWPDIEMFCVRQVWPRTTEWRNYTPQEWARFLADYRKEA